MFKLQRLQPWATTARQLSTTSTSTNLRGPSSSSSLPLRAFAIPRFASYSTDSSDEYAGTYNPWKEWIRPNKRAQARYDLYGEHWFESQNGKEKGIETTLNVQRERSRGHLRNMLGDQYDTVIAETKKEAFERYETKEWRQYIENLKKDIIAKDDNRRELGIMAVQLPESSRKDVGDQD